MISERDLHWSGLALTSTKTWAGISSLDNWSCTWFSPYNYIQNTRINFQPKEEFEEIIIGYIKSAIRVRIYPGYPGVQ